MPRDTRYAGSVQYGNTMALIGGQDGENRTEAVYLFNPDAMSWVPGEESLSMTRDSMIAILVDENIFPDC